MGLEKCGLNLDASQREMKSHGTLEFPCAGYLEDLDCRGEDIPWHWHDDLEILYVKSGKLRVRIPSESFDLSAGDCLVVNCGILHSAKAEPKCRLHSVVFNPLLVTGNADSVYAVKYLSPLISCGVFRSYRLKRKTDGEMVQSFTDAFRCMETDAPGFEFNVREKLSRFCYLLYRKYAANISGSKAIRNQDDLRIRKMLDFIQTHYREDITLKEISGAADIGQRESLRCFKRSIQLSPVQYLLKYRIMKGAQLLISHPADSISETAGSCGFDSPSYFTKTFRKFFGCSPKKYRCSSR